MYTYKNYIYIYIDQNIYIKTQKIIKILQYIGERDWSISNFSRRVWTYGKSKNVRAFGFLTFSKVPLSKIIVSCNRISIVNSIARRAQNFHRQQVSCASFSKALTICHYHDRVSRR